MDNMLNKIVIGHWVILASLLVLVLAGLDLTAAWTWFGVFCLLYTSYSMNYLRRWTGLQEGTSDDSSSLLSGLNSKRDFELVLILAGLAFGLLSIWWPLGLARAGVTLSATLAIHLVMTLMLEWEVGIHHDKDQG